MSWSEITTALQQGVVDAIEPTGNNWTADKLYEIAPYVTTSDHMLSTYIVLTNEQWWASLPDDIRAQLTQILKETTDYNWKITEEENNAALDEIAANPNGELVRLTPDELKQWQAAVRPLYTKYAGSIGKDIMDAVYKHLDASN